MAGVAAAAGATAGQADDTEAGAVVATIGQGVSGAAAAQPPGISARARAREELQAQLIQGILRMHARSKVDLASLMSYLQSALQTRADAASAGSEPRHRPLPATDTGRLAKRQRRGPAADVVLDSVLLDSLLSTALEHRSELFGNHVRVTGQRLMLAALHMAHQNNSAAYAAMRVAAETVSASSAARAGEVGAAGKRWLPGLLLRLADGFPRAGPMACARVEVGVEAGDALPTTLEAQGLRLELICQDNMGAMQL
ncbi:hypothetical protein V8C86DRAFT_2683129 [Haematococcus lacustris]